MSKLLGMLRRFAADESGPTAVEYAVMLALIIVVCITAVTALGNNASNIFSNVALNAAASGAKDCGDMGSRDMGSGTGISTLAKAMTPKLRGRSL